MKECLEGGEELSAFNSAFGSVTGFVFAESSDSQSVDEVPLRLNIHSPSEGGPQIPLVETGTT